MATIVYREGRPKPWLAQIKRKGHPIYSKSFRLKDRAERWARKEEDRIEATGLFDFREYQKVTVGALAARYLAEISPQKPTFETEKYVISCFLRRAVARKSIALVSTQDGAIYRNERLTETYGGGKTIKPPTVRRELNILQHIFEVARTEWGYSDIRNPFRGLRIKDSDIPRERRVTAEELERLVGSSAMCRRPNRYYVSLAIFLAVHTGMRLQEIFNLSFMDVMPLENRRIVIRKSKTDQRTRRKGRTIVMSSLALNNLEMICTLRMRLSDLKNDFLEKTIFPMTKKAFKYTWNRVRNRAGITDLTFHDLRHEAGSRFDEMGLTKAEHDLMMGHKNRDMASRYTHTDDLKRQHIQEKMDAFFVKDQM